MAGRNNDVTKIASILCMPLNVISIEVYGDQDLLAFCLPISVETHQILSQGINNKNYHVTHIVFASKKDDAIKMTSNM